MHWDLSILAAGTGSGAGAVEAVKLMYGVILIVRVSTPTVEKNEFAVYLYTWTFHFA